MPCNSVEITFWNARIDPLKRFSRMALFTALTCLAVPVAAQDFRASNYMTVTPLSNRGHRALRQGAANGGLRTGPRRGAAIPGGDNGAQHPQRG